jgi:hypothetical protein
MQVSGQLHALAALIPRKEPPVPIVQDSGWAPEPSHYTDWATAAPHDLPVLYTKCDIPWTYYVYWSSKFFLICELCRTVYSLKLCAVLVETAQSVCVLNSCVLVTGSWQSFPWETAPTKPGLSWMKTSAKSNISVSLRTAFWMDNFAQTE